MPKDRKKMQEAWRLAQEKARKERESSLPTIPPKIEEPDPPKETVESDIGENDG